METNIDSADSVVVAMQSNMLVIATTPINIYLISLTNIIDRAVSKTVMRSYGVMVSTLDFESSDPGSNPGRSLFFVRILCVIDAAGKTCSIGHWKVTS